MQLGWQNERGKSGSHGSRRIWGLRDIIRYQSLESLLVENYLIQAGFDLDLNRVCSNNVSNSRSSMLCASSFGKDRLLSR
jgi:hypothetical protein